MNAGQRGFGAIVAIVILVIMATLAAGLIRLGTTQQATSTQDILSARAWQVARAGTEWGLYQALKSGSCIGATTLDLRAATGFSVTVSCSSQSPSNTCTCPLSTCPSPPYPPYYFCEGETSPGKPQAVITYSIKAIACNFPDPVNGCVNNTSATVPGYVERERLVIANTP